MTSFATPLNGTGLDNLNSTSPARAGAGKCSAAAKSVAAIIELCLFMQLRVWPNGKVLVVGQCLRLLTGKNWADEP